MNDLIINVEKSTRMVLMTKTTVGNDMENLQEKIIFKFTDKFVDGQARLEYKIGSTKNYIELTKENNTYILPIQNVLAKEGKIEMQLVITESTEEENIPVFKSNVFYLYCNRSLNAVNEAPEGYDLWIEQANAKLNAMDEALTEVDNLDIDATKTGNTATVSIKNKEGITKSVEVHDGETGQDGYSPTAIVSKSGNTSTITITDKNGTTTASVNDGINGIDGIDGKDAKINGVNTLSIEAGTNITLDQEGSTLTINSTGGGGGGTSNYNVLTNKPKINNVELNGNKTSSDLGIQPAGNYALKSEIPTVPTKVSEFTNDAGYLTSHQDISGKLDVAKFYNDYYFSMPKTIYVKLNTEMKFYYNNITTANYLLKWGQYTNSTTIRDNDDYISVLPTAKATKNITYQVYDRFLNSIESGTTSFVINDTKPSSQTMLIIGDSFVSFNYIGPDLRDLFTNDGNTLTLIGTQGSGLNKHEGYAGWKYTDFTTNSKASSNPFWDGSKFNFTYYMNQNGYSNLDSVYIQLGTNDASAGSANQNMTDVINAAQTMINSILEYNSNIKIYLGLTVMPTLKTSKFAEKYNGIGLNWIMRANMQKLNKALIDTFSNNSSIKIVANNLILDSTTDISDNVHPTRTGFTKIANQVYYTMMS